MSVNFNHTIVYARDSRASATFLDGPLHATIEGDSPRNGSTTPGVTATVPGWCPPPIRRHWNAACSGAAKTRGDQQVSRIDD
jgi:hypothetical protein